MKGRRKGERGREERGREERRWGSWNSHNVSITKES